MRTAVDDVLPELEIASVRRSAMKTTALLLRDPNPIHWDLERVRELGLGDRPVNQGPLNIGYILEMLGAWAGSVDRVQSLSCRFAGNVFGGDRLVAGGRVTEVDEHDGVRTATCEVWLRRDGTETVVTGTAAVVMDA